MPRAVASRKKPAAAERDSYHHGDVPGAIRAATLELLREGGAQSLSLREAARRVGVNHRAVYRHFADKRALLAAIAKEGYEMLAMAMRAGLDERQDGRPAGDPVERFVALGEGYLRFARREPERYEVMFGPRLNVDGKFPELEAAIIAAVSVLQTEIQQVAPAVPGMRRRDAGVAFWSAIHGFSSLVLVGRVPLKEAHLERYVGVLLRPLATGLIAALRAEPRAIG